jgi:cell division protein FtsA
MAKSTIYAGLEIGTHKICVVVGEAKRDGAIKILGHGTAPSRGVRKGEIVDFEKVHTVLNDALVRAEDRSDVMIRNVFLGVTGAHIQSLNNIGGYRLPEDQAEITEDDVEEAKEQARNIEVPQTNVFLHSITRQYIVDGKEAVRQPIGQEARELQAEYHIIHGVRARIQNTIRCVRDVPLEVEDVVFAPIAAAQVMLNREAKQQGALMLDFGAGTVDYVLYVDGMVTASGCVPLGGDHITTDIAQAFEVMTGQARRLQEYHGSCDYESVPADEILPVEDEHGLEVARIERAFLNEVIYLRTREILLTVRERVEPHLHKISAGIYLTGGVSLLKGIERVATEVFERRVARQSLAQISGVSSNYDDPRFTMPIGLIRYAQILDSEKPFLSPLARLGRKMADLIS